MMKTAVFLACITTLLTTPAMTQEKSGITLGNKLVCTSEIKMRDGSVVKPGKQNKSGRTVREQVSMPTEANSFASVNFVRVSECTDRKDSSSCYRYLFTQIPGLAFVRTEQVKDFDVSGVVFHKGTLTLDGYRKFNYDDIISGGPATILDLTKIPQNSSQTIGVIHEPITILREANSIDVQLSYPEAVEVKSECVIDRSYTGTPVGRWESASFDEASYSQDTIFYFGYGFTKAEASKRALAQCRKAGGKSCIVGSSEQNDQQSSTDLKTN